MSCGLLVRHGMSGWMKIVFSCRLKTDIDGDAMRSGCQTFSTDLQWLWSHGHQWQCKALVECSAQMLRQTEVAMRNRCLSHGAVHMQGILQPYCAKSGRRARRAWAGSAGALLASESHTAAVLCGRTYKLYSVISQWLHRAQLNTCHACWSFVYDAANWLSPR